MDRKPEGGAEENELWCLDSPVSVSSTSAMRGDEGSHWGVGGEGWALADVCFLPAQSAPAVHE